VLEVLPLSQADQLPARTGLAAIDPDIPLAKQMTNAARSAGRTQPEILADLAIDAFDCESLLDRVPRPMSRGERQICSILVTLSAPIVALSIIDPTAGLDGQRRRVAVNLFVDLAADRPVAVASDDIGFVGYRQ
jgi:energy-coupling factor transporter ATP-binding protein EcfA2